MGLPLVLLMSSPAVSNCTRVKFKTIALYRGYMVSMSIPSGRVWLSGVSKQVYERG